MKRTAFIFMILGFIALLFLLNSRAKEISNLNELKKLEVNNKVRISGEVILEQVISLEKKIFRLNNGIELVCDGCYSKLDGKRISAEGIISKFNEKKRVELTQIDCLDAC